MKVKEFLKKHKKWCIIGAVMVVVLAGICSFISRAKKAEERMTMTPMQETAEVERRSLMESVSATGTVTSAQSKNISVALSGLEVKEVCVKVGDSVEAGDVICVLDSADLEEDLADAKTTLNAASGKTAIEVASAQRGLSEAETTRDIETSRAYEDENEAYNDYLRSKTDEEEAENDYREAQEATVIKNGEWEAAKEKLEDAEDDMEDAKEEMEKLAAAAGKTGTYASEFESMVSTIQRLIGDNKDSASLDAVSYLYIGNEKLNTYSASDFVAENTDEELKKQINDSLGTLVGLQSSYNLAQADQEAYEASSAKYQQALADYQEAQQEASSWESKYNSAKNSESSYENAYDQAISNSDAKYDAYEQQIRNREDTIRNNETSVNNKEDNLSTSQLNATTSGLSDKQQIRQLEEQIEDCTVKAPISGVITSLNVEEGDTYSSSTIAVIENTASYEVEAEIDEYDISKIEVGQKVVIKTNGTGDIELEGTVTEVAPRASSDSGSSDVTYKVTVSIDTECEELRMDMTAKLSIVIESKDNVLTVPYDAVQEAEDGTFYVEVAEENQQASADEVNRNEQPAGMQQSEKKGKENRDADVRTERRITIEKGIESDYYIEVISDEITEGMQVIVPVLEDSGTDFKGMVGRQGPMGGF